jgi:hypothetical protein
VGTTAVDHGFGAAADTAFPRRQCATWAAATGFAGNVARIAQGIDNCPEFGQALPSGVERSDVSLDTVGARCACLHIQRQSRSWMRILALAWSTAVVSKNTICIC